MYIFHSFYQLLIQFESHIVGNIKCIHWIPIVFWNEFSTSFESQTNMVYGGNKQTNMEHWLTIGFIQPQKQTNSSNKMK